VDFALNDVAKSSNFRESGMVAIDERKRVTR